MNSSKRILIIGPETTNDKIQALKDAGFIIEYAVSVEEASVKFTSESYSKFMIGELELSSLIPSRPAQPDETGLPSSLLNAIANCTDANLAYFDRNFDFVWVNDTYCEKCGRSREDLIGRNHFELFPHPENEAIFIKVRDTGEPHEVREKPFEYPDHSEWGVTYWDWTLTPIKKDDGAVQGLVLSLVDVTVRKRAELKLKEQAHMLELAHVLIRDMNDVVVFWNKGAEKMYGWSRDEALGNVSHELLRTVFPCDLSTIEAEIMERESWEGELVHKRRDGKEIVVASHWVLHKDENGNPIAILEVNNDITALKQARAALVDVNDELEAANEELLAANEEMATANEELTTINEELECEIAERIRIQEALYESEERLRLANESADLGTWDFDPVSGKVEMSARCREYFGFSPNDKSPDFWSPTNIHPHDKARRQKLIEQALDPDGDGSYTTEFRTLQPDGTTAWYASKGRCFFKETNGRKQAVRLIGTIHDITDRKLAEEEHTQRIANLDSLVRVTAGVLAETTLEGLLQRVCDAACELAGAKVSVAGRSGKDGFFHVRSTSVQGSAPQCPMIDISSIEAWKAYLELMEGSGSFRLTYQELTSHPNLLTIPQEQTSAGGVLGASLVDIGGRHSGLIVVSGKEAGEFSEEDEAILSQLAAVASLGMQHIEARRQAERRAAEMESFMSSMADGVMLFDLQGKVAWMNESGRNILGLSAEGDILPGIAEYKFYSMENNPMAFEQRPGQRALRGEYFQGCNCRMISPHRDIVVSVSASPVRDSGGRVIGATSVFRDVSEQVKFEQQRQELYEREHKIADMLQQALIPPQLPSMISGCELAAKYQPALKEAEVGGDFYDVFELSKGKFGVLIGDVAGKGLAAAIRVASARHAIRSYAFLEDNPAKVLALANSSLCKDEIGAPHMLTAFFAVVDAAEGMITYACGGHEPPVIGNAGTIVEELVASGPALGMFDGLAFTQADRKLETGDTIVMVTDGITEARRSGGILYGKESVVEYVGRCCCLPSEQIADGLLEAARAYAGGSLQDDAAIVVLKVSAEGDN